MILVFPPVTSQLRHLTHKFIDNFYSPYLCSFSVGQDDDRRVLVGSTTKIIRCSLPYACIHEKLFSTSKVPEKLADCICSRRSKLMRAQDSEFAAFMSAYDKSRKAVGKDLSASKIGKMKENSKALLRDRQRRPDKPLYVPRALRKTNNENVEKTSISSTDDIDKHEPITSTCPEKSNDLSSDKLHQTVVNFSEPLKSSSNDILESVQNNKPQLQMSSHVQTVKVSDVSSVKSVTEESCGRPLVESEKSADCVNPNIDVENTLTSNITIEDEHKCNTELSAAAFMLEIKSKSSDDTNEESSASINDSGLNTDSSAENADDSWETMFNDEGECLDPKFLKELCDITGRVELTVTKGDYSDYQPISRSSTEEYEHIVELYGFPVEFSTQDLTSAFSTFPEASYNIKWVDDCHAIAIFSSPVIASQALHLAHPFIKVRPLSEGIKESKDKAKFCSRLLEVKKPRPATSAALARRLVSGALGLKDRASKEQRDIERNMLKEAKEKKKLKAKQRQDIWNGIVS